MVIPKNMQGLVLLHDGFDATGRATGLEDFSDCVELRQLSVPQHGPGQALIRVSRAAVNHADVAFIRGYYGMPRVKGVAAGFEGTGTVVAGDTPLVGQRVSFASPTSGTWAEYALANIAQLIPLRDELRDEDAAGLIINPISAAVMCEIARESGAKSFVATGAGSQLVKFLIPLAREKGCPCIAIVRRPALAQQLKDLGALEVLVSEDAEFAERFRSVSLRYKPRVLLDAIADQVSSDIFFAMPNHSIWVIYGRLAISLPVLNDPEQFIVANKQIKGFWLTSWFLNTAPEEVAKVIADVQARFIDGRWQTNVSETVALQDAMSLLPSAFSQKDGKVLLAL
ncbi:NADPH:quinone reductase-like Zn-dependent oxidoreductase [Yoonia sediminilitoris]|uniref:NADPH:quinone reductase-like Zn-dependent oxidoreductase n=2 Tax=Yoonia sediminilitoris TaxID=1286148 RepID=A0A2T6K8R6_9RHOB|nr:NADPH:quinone reductase-like Zn-dependent oxidoreductase [Yoonia sediminilitoris]RCW91022.1 NADPH:quinone reductase-like Zn-dependent oxidoreductase [Yoonia sediminilitoris]